MRYLVLFLVIFSSLLISCSGDNPGSGDSGQLKQVDDDDFKKSKIDSDEISGKQYALISRLEFNASDIQGESSSRYLGDKEVYQRFFQDRREVSKSSVGLTDQYCLIEAQVDSDHTASFPPGPLYQIGLQELSQFSHSNGKTVREESFALYLQPSQPPAFALVCFNTFNSTEIINQVGHLIEVREDQPSESRPSRREFEPKSLGIQLLSKITDPDYPFINNVITIANEDLPKEFQSVELQVTLSLPGQPAQRLGQAVEVYNFNGTTLGDLVLTFSINPEVAKILITRMQMAQYELKFNEGTTLVLDLGKMCQEKPNAIIDLSTDTSGCHSFVPRSSVSVTMLVAYNRCAEEKFDFPAVNKIDERRRSGKSMTGDNCEDLIWYMMDDGWTDLQIIYVHMYLGGLKSLQSCKGFRSTLGYQTLRQIERQQETVERVRYPDGSYTQVSDQDLYELCLAVK